MSTHPPSPPDHEDAPHVATTWLADRHRKGWQNAFDALMQLWRPGTTPAEWQLDAEGILAVAANTGDWLLSRGEIHARGGLRNINDYLLSREGPYFTPRQRDWIAQLRERPLRLYRVTDVQPGAGMTLVDELDPRASPYHVREVSGSRAATPGLLLGARIMQVAAQGDSDAHLGLSGAMYPFLKLAEPAVLARARQVLDGSGDLKLHPDNPRDLLELEIARAWLDQWFAPAPLPQIQDASTGDPLVLVTDHYRVLDAAALAAALASQPDVTGDAQEGWDRAAKGTDGALRSLSAINPGRRADRVELFHRTQELADAGRAWFEGVVGSAVQHQRREVQDPLDSAGHVGGRSTRRKPRGSAASAPDLPPEAMAQLMEQTIHRFYAFWADEPIPVLGGRTPRQAIATPAGLERVKGLLREYEHNERAQSAAQRRPEVSYQFLWDALEISR